MTDNMAHPYEVYSKDRVSTGEVLFLLPDEVERIEAQGFYVISIPLTGNYTVSILSALNEYRRLSSELIINREYKSLSYEERQLFARLLIDNYVKIDDDGIVRRV